MKQLLRTNLTLSFRFFTHAALQKFIFIDGPNAEQYRLPATDFPNVWLVQAHGSRTVRLEPSPECERSCSTLMLTLHAKQVLYFNWQFYRLRSLPFKKANGLSVSFISSFY